MKLLFIDFETQSEDAETTLPIEVGMTYTSFEDDLFSDFETSSQFIWDPLYPPQTKDNIEITGITDDILAKEVLTDPYSLFGLHIIPRIASVDYIFAHNKLFDQTVFEKSCERLEIDYPKRDWICTLNDIPWSKKYKCKKLSHLAFDHGIIADPTKLHRAGYDTEILAKLITEKYDINEILAYVAKPWVYVRALIAKPWEDQGVGKTQAKKLGFSWEKIYGTPYDFPGAWVKRVKEDEIEQMKATYPFKMSRLNVDV